MPAVLLHLLGSFGLKCNAFPLHFAGHFRENRAMMDWPTSTYKTVVVDPPWPTGGYADKPKGSQTGVAPTRHPYALMSVDEIAALPVPDILAPDALAFIWTTSRFLPTAFAVCEGWGLTYMCTMVWDKIWGPKPIPYPMYNAEFILVAKRGRPRFLDTKRFRLVNQWPALIDPSIKNMNQRVSSAKPEGFYALLRRVTPAPRIDIFGRRAIVGFDSWGNEAPGMSHNCGSTCKRKTGESCATCRVGGGHSRRPHATPAQIGAAVGLYFDGLSYRRCAENVDEILGRPTNPATVYRWVQEQTRRAGDVVNEIKVDTGDEWVADELTVNVGGEQYWLFNVMDSETRFVLAAYLSPERTTRAAQTAMAMARERAANPPKIIKTDGLRSYRQGVSRAFPTFPVKHVVSQGIRAQINNNLSERLQGTFRDRDKTLRALKRRDTGQAYIDGLVLNYNYFRPHGGLRGKRPAEAAGAAMPFRNWREVAEMESA